MTDAIVKLLSEYGLNLALLALAVSALTGYVWRDWKRLATLEDRVTQLETELRTLTTDTLARMDQALRESTTQLRISSKVIEDFLLRPR